MGSEMCIRDSVSCVDLADCSPPVEVEPAHEHCSLVLLAADETLLLPAKILVVGPELGAGEAEAGWWAVGGRIPRLASEAIRDFRL